MGKAYDGTRISSYNYAYYLDGNIKSENTRTFTYDNLGRLKQEQNGTDTISYTYDKFGNRASMTKNEAVTSYTYDLNNRLLQEVSGDEFTFYNYDNKGNLYSKRTEERSAAGGLTRVDTFGTLKDNANSTVEIYSYNGLNRMTEARKGGVTAQYTYNAEGIRTSKTVNGITTDFLLDGANVVAETKDNITTNYIRGVSGIISSSIQGTNDSTKYYTSDGHGNITNLTDSTGTIVKTYVYDAFGVEQNIDSNDTNPFRYCGEYYDSEIGQIYLRARYYNPALGRFTQSDPAMSGVNWYLYCENEPVNRTDSTGLDFDYDEMKWIVDRYDWNVVRIAGLASEYARKQAEKYAQAMGLNKTYDNKADAWRHFLWNAKMTKELNAGKAKVIADYHEYKAAKDLGWVKSGSYDSGRIVTKMNQAMLMDLWNNQVGRKMALLSEGMTVSYEHMWQHAMNKGYIIQNAEDVFSFLGVEDYIDTSDWTVTVTWEIETGNVTVHKTGKDDVTLKIGV